MNDVNRSVTDNPRPVAEVLVARPASDGAGVRLLRVFGGPRPERFDPFLMLDEFGSYDANDYIAGFPSHPHRGFETVTYMLEGRMEHRDHMNNVGLLQPGDVQWMKAGSGVIHSEMPKQDAGRMRGFQLWVNLPSREKMTPAEYQDVPAAQIPDYTVDGATLRAIAGQLTVNGVAVPGYIQHRSTEPGYLDLHLPATGGQWRVDVPADHTVLVYVYEGDVQIGSAGTRVAAQQLARLGAGDHVRLQTRAASRVLVITGKPIGEPIVQYGPFVMNTEQEIHQAIHDYNAGRLTA